MSEPTITKCEIKEDYWGLCAVWVQLTNGDSKTLFRFYSDELAFTEAELIGMTEAEARLKRHQRDVEYLQS